MDSIPHAAQVWQVCAPRLLLSCLLYYLIISLLLALFRFATDPRFPWVALNQYQRRQARSIGRVFLQREGVEKAGVSDLTAADLHRMMDKDPALVQRATHWSRDIRGTAPYWTAAKRDLDSMVNQLGCPSAFVTFSAADSKWEDMEPLFRGRDHDYTRKRGDDLKEYSDLAVHYFHARTKAFFQQYMTPMFNMTDYWVRYEFQAR